MTSLSEMSHLGGYCNLLYFQRKIGDLDLMQKKIFRSCDPMSLTSVSFPQGDIKKKKKETALL